MRTLQNLLLDELADIYYAEKHLATALLKLSAAATDEELREVLDAHRDETEGHARLVENVFKCFGQAPRAKKCDAILGLLREGERIVAENTGAPTVNAAIISAAQKVEHYEIASYGCLLEWAGQLEKPEAVGFLEEILEDEKAVDAELTALARARCNDAALNHEEDAEEAMMQSRSRRSSS